MSESIPAGQFLGSGGATDLPPEARCAYFAATCPSHSSCMLTGKCVRQAEREAMMAPPSTTDLTPKDRTSRLITLPEVVGQIAMFAVRQHPYGRPHGLFELCDAVSEASKGWPDASLRMWRIDGWPQLERWLRPIFEAHWAPTEWNKPRSGHDRKILFISRYEPPKPEHDFIDIDALLRNVAIGVWRESV